jgi:hypothetical protein
MAYWCQLPPSAAQAPDPYVRWAQLSGWRSYRRAMDGRSEPPEAVRIIAGAADHEALAAALGDPRLNIPPAYHYRVPGSAARSKPALHFTATVQREHLGHLVHSHPGLRWELAAPMLRSQSLARADARGEGGPARAWSDVRSPPVVPQARARAAQVGGDELGDTLAAVDYGVPFLAADLCGADRLPRIRALWDQDERPADASQPGWWSSGEEVRAMAYGRELRAQALDALGEAAHPAAGVGPDEASIYRSIDYLIATDDARRRAYAATHGGAVLGALAGAPDPLERWRRGRAAQRDAAALADLAFVHLPGMTVADSAGSSLSAQLLDAVRYLMHLCSEDARLVISISYGSFASSHDGTSLVEAALDELLELRPRNFAIVLAAGNSRREACHVRRRVDRSRTALLRLDLEPGDTTDTFVELWHPRPTAGAVGLQARVRTAGRDWGPWVDRNSGSALLRDDATRRPLALLQHDLHPAGSTEKALFLLSMAPTAASLDDDGPLCEPGRWEIEVRMADDGPPVEFDAWVERDDPGDAGARSQSRFAGTWYDDDCNTLSSIASGRHTIIAGGYRLGSREPAPYSSLPGLDQQERRRLWAYAPCEEDGVVRSLPSTATRSGERFRMNGTSMAAPALARQLFNAMAGQTVQRREWPAALERLAREADDTLVLLPPRE